MFHGGLFGIADSEDDQPDLGSAFELAGQIITDPSGTADEVTESVTGRRSRERRERDRTKTRRERRREFRRKAQQDRSSDPDDAPEPRRGKQRKPNGIVRQIVDATGATEFAQSEQAEQLRREREAARRQGGISGALREIDAATKAGLDFLLDNPRASLQDTTREGIEAATGVESERQGEAAAELGQEFNRTLQGLTVDTPLENPVTDAVGTGFEWLIADPAKAGLTAVTGIDVDEGSSEGTVGAIDAFDVGVTVGTLGVGKAGLGAAKAAARSSDETGGLVARLLSRGGRSADETARTIDEVATGADEAAQADELLPVLADEAAQAGDNLPVLADETAGLVDEAAQVSDEGTGILSRLGIRFGDDTAGLTDDVTRLTDEAGGVTDELAQAGDEAVQVAEEGGGLLSRITGSRAATFGVATGGVVAGGALLDALGTFDRLEVTDDQGNEYLLINEKQYQPTPEHSEGGVLWRVDQTGGSSLGYTVMVGVQGRNVYILDQDGGRMRAKVSADQFNEAIQRARGAN